MEALRKLFEAAPGNEVPEGVYWPTAEAKQYIPMGSNNFDLWKERARACEHYNAKWSGFQLAHSLMGRDAERYRWLRSDGNMHVRVTYDCVPDSDLFESDLDDVVDAALSNAGEGRG